MPRYWHHLELATLFPNSMAASQVFTDSTNNVRLPSSISYTGAGYNQVVATVGDGGTGHQKDYATFLGILAAEANAATTLAAAATPTETTTATEALNLARAQRPANIERAFRFAFSKCYSVLPTDITDNPAGLRADVIAWVKQQNAFPRSNFRPEWFA